MQVQLVHMEWLGLLLTHTYSPHHLAPPQHFTWPRGQDLCVTIPPAIERGTLFIALPHPSLQTPTADWPTLLLMPSPPAETPPMWAGQTVRPFPAHRLAYLSRSLVCLAMPLSCNISCPVLATMPSQPIRAHRAHITVSASIVHMVSMDTTSPPHRGWLPVLKRWPPHRAQCLAPPPAVL